MVDDFVGFFHQPRLTTPFTAVHPACAICATGSTWTMRRCSTTCCTRALTRASTRWSCSTSWRPSSTKSWASSSCSSSTPSWRSSASITAAAESWPSVSRNSPSSCRACRKSPKVSPLLSSINYSRIYSFLVLLLWGGNFENLLFGVVPSL